MTRWQPRDVHPVAWWVWAIGMAAAASVTYNPLVLGLILMVVSIVVVARRSNQPWANSFRIYLILGLIVIVMRLIFRLIFGGGTGDTVWLALPRLELPGGTPLLGDLTRESFLAGLYDGLRLAAIIICIGAANALANPKRLLKSAPPALYEIGTVLVVAVTILPQLAHSVRRVRRAQALRGAPRGRWVSLRRTLMPVLEDALERSLALAAGMDTRGYGRVGEVSKRTRWVTGLCMLAGLVGICIGVYALLDRTTPQVLATPMVILGLSVAGIGFVLAGRRVHRSRYRPDPWKLPELTVIVSGLAAAAGTIRWSQTEESLAYPDLYSPPAITATVAVVLLVGLIPAFATPLPRLVGTAR